MSNKGPKVVDTLYAVIINDDVVQKEFKKLSDARQYIKDMKMTDDIRMVEVVKQCTTHTLLNTYKPQITKTLVASDLDFGGEWES